MTQQIGCCPETVRYTIKHFDTQNPDRAVFPRKGQLSDHHRQEIYQRHRRGYSALQLARQCGQSPARIRRVIQEMRAAWIMELPLEHMPNPEFSRPGAANRILGPMPVPPGAQRKARPPAGLSPYLASLYEVPLLTRDQELSLFRKYNFLKYEASKVRDQFNPAKPTARPMDEIERLYEQAVEAKNQILRANLRLVVSIAKRYANPATFFDLISEGNMSLIRAIEKFDYARGFKFSTYATWAIQKNFARDYVNQIRQFERFRTSQEERLDAAADGRADTYKEERLQERREKQVQKILDCLTEREREIIGKRFGIVGSPQGQTLKEVGAASARSASARLRRGPWPSCGRRPRRRSLNCRRLSLGRAYWSIDRRRSLSRRQVRTASPCGGSALSCAVSSGAKANRRISSCCLTFASADSVCSTSAISSTSNAPSKYPMSWSCMAVPFRNLYGCRAVDS